MKKLTAKIILFSSALILGVTFSSVGQEKNNAQNTLNKIVLTPYIPEQIETLPEGAAALLKSKLNQISNENGIAGSTNNSRFIITSNINVLTKDLLTTAPPMTALTLDVALHIGDGIEGRKFTSKSITVKGVGTTEENAYFNALRSIQSDDAAIQTFVSNGKSKIINYYKTTCGQFIKTAQSLAEQHKYGEAIFKLNSIPEECIECHDKALTAIKPIYKKYIDADCKQKLTKANALWSANQDLDTANTIAELVGSIDPQSANYKDVRLLTDKISKRVYELDNREWNFKLDAEINLNRDMIQAYRDISVSYQNSLPQNIIYNVRGWL